MCLHRLISQLTKLYQLFWAETVVQYHESIHSCATNENHFSYWRASRGRFLFLCLRSGITSLKQATWCAGPSLLQSVVWWVHLTDSIKGFCKIETRVFVVKNRGVCRRVRRVARIDSGNWFEQACVSAVVIEVFVSTLQGRHEPWSTSQLVQPWCLAFLPLVPPKMSEWA